MTINKRTNLDERTVIIPTSGGCGDCGGKCLQTMSRMGEIKVETDNGEEPH
jgi:hypothetical protein